MRDEIIAGLKNALERGESMDSAVQSFLSAGYNPETVKEAAASLSSGVSAFIPQSIPDKKSDSKTFIPKKEIPSSNITAPVQPSTESAPKKSHLVLYIVISLIVILVGAIGVVLYSNPDLLSKITSYFTGG